MLGLNILNGNIYDFWKSTRMSYLKIYTHALNPSKKGNNENVKNSFVFNIITKLITSHKEILVLK